MWDCPCGCRNIAADVSACPMCSEERVMPKVTSGGASNVWEEQEAAAQAPVETAAPAPVAAEEDTPAAPEAPAAVAAPDVASMNKAQLQAHADSLGLPTDGTKADLTARITDHVEAAAAESAPAQAEAAS